MLDLNDSKANVLRHLEGRLKHAIVLPQLTINYAQFGASSDLASLVNIVCSTSAPTWLHESVIVRSSCLDEDTSDTSNAGKYLSLLNLQGENQIYTAIQRVFESMDPSPDDQVFVQPMLDNVAISGVAFSMDPNTKSPYYVIDYENSGDTEAVTSGKSKRTITQYIYRLQPNIDLVQWQNQLVTLLTELEQIFDCKELDVEFAINKEFGLHLLQVRRLVMTKRDDEFCVELDNGIRRIASKIKNGINRHPYLFGDRTVFGVMPDWNPAEIIGIRPRPLSLSLYKELFTDSIWAYQRNNYGYKNLRSFPLLVDFCGLPFIDVRVSFNSFLPADLPESLSEKLIDYYIDKLAQNPKLHDKVEFEIIFSCYTFDIQERLNALLKVDFEQHEVDELESNLKTLTNKIINNASGLWIKDTEKLDKLSARQNTILSSELPILDKIYWLIEDAKRYGTLPFAGLARAAFIAVQMLRSLVSVGALTENDYNNFLSGLKTVSSTMHGDYNRMCKDDFLRKYGHLRPGTYDILSARYDETPELYFDWKDVEAESVNVDVSLSITQLNEIQRLLSEHGLAHDALSLVNFIKGAIEGREYAKFVFSRSLSNTLSLLKTYGAEIGLTTEDMSYMGYEVIPKLYSSSLPVADTIRASILEGRKKHTLTSSISLPPLICEVNHVYSFEVSEDLPNFITQTSTTAETAIELDGAELSGKIVLIESADPGYDWLFAKNIAGLITMYGGVNSHMAIRAGELGIPAAIGAGEKLFLHWKLAKTLELDCANRTVRIIK